LVPVFLLGLIGLMMQSAGLTGTWIGLFMAVVVVALYSTVQLAFPAVALGEATSLDKAWQQGMNSLGQMVGINVVLLLIVGVPIVIIDYALGQLAVQLAGSIGISGVVVVVIIADIIFAPIYLIGMALLATAVCLVYRRLVPGSAVS